MSVSCCCGSDVFMPCVSLIFHPISHPEEIGLCKNNSAKELVWNWNKQSPFWSSSFHMALNNAFLYFFFLSRELYAKIIFDSFNLDSTPHPSKTITDKHHGQLPLASLTTPYVRHVLFCTTVSGPATWYTPPNPPYIHTHFF